ncbi:hypothetical protein [Streptomyces sp. NBC_01233]|uniref:hypothetical protein n=1 Tax=Streptomyces sp. NBC_01233 TaxID=2903787 RepID=UPI002E12E8BA|nr:hypothetical protein OG332_39880 [Streptomyces sp. NBC_01233]
MSRVGVVARVPGHVAAVNLLMAVVGTVLASRFHGNPQDPAQVAAFTDAMGAALRTVAVALLCASAAVVAGYRAGGRRGRGRDAVAAAEGAS